MKRRTWNRVSAVLLLLGSLARLTACADPPTASALSPDGSFRVDLVETTSFLDRNFRIELTEVATGRSETIFESPDEGRPIGTERFVWSTDGTRFVLLGRNFFVTPEGTLANDEQAYLMMHVPSEEIWCNARATTTYPRFEVDELRSVDWQGWTPR